LLENGTTVVGQTTLPAWQYKPSAIYIEADAALEWGTDHTVKIVGNPDKVTASYSDTYTLDSEDYLGSDLIWLDEWVYQTSYLFEDYYSEDFLTEVSGLTLLNNLGSTVFSKGIPGLEDIRPSLYSMVENPIPVTGRTFSTTYEDSLAGGFGARAIAAFTALGTFTGVGGPFLMAFFWIALLILVAGLVGGLTGSPIASAVVSLPVLFIGVYLGTIPVPIMALIGTGAAFYLIYSLWLRGT
jgi:hypothetical protein